MQRNGQIVSSWGHARGDGVANGTFMDSLMLSMAQKIPLSLGDHVSLINRMSFMKKITLKLLVFLLIWIASHSLTLLTAECIWFKCDLYLRFIPLINIRNIWNDLRPFLKCKEGPFSRSWRSLRSNNLQIQNDKNSK